MQFLEQLSDQCYILTTLPLVKEPPVPLSKTPTGNILIKVQRDANYAV